MNEQPPASRPPRFPITRLWLVVTGETEDTSSFPDFTGHTDPQLSALGRKQAEAVAREIALVAIPTIAAIYTSPLSSAIATAEVIAGTLGIASIEPHQSLVTVMPEELPPGRDGEAAFEMIQERAWQLVEALKDRYEPDVGLILVSHLLPVRGMVSRALGLPTADSDRFGLEAGSISAIEFRGPRTIVGVLNDVCHLEDS